MRDTDYFKAELEKCKKAVKDTVGRPSFSGEFLRKMGGWCEDKDVVLSCFLDRDVDCIDHFHTIFQLVKSEIEGAKRGETLYRGILVDPIEFKAGDLESRPLGTSWTWDKSCARRNGNCDSKITEDLVILEGDRPSSVEAYDTMDTNIELDMLEREIRLAPRSLITLKRVCRHVKVGEGFEEVCEDLGKLGKRLVV